MCVLCVCVCVCVVLCVCVCVCVCASVKEGYSVVQPPDGGIDVMWRQALVPILSSFVFSYLSINFY